MQRGVLSSLHAMVRPQHLGAVKHLGGFKRCFTAVSAGKRCMACRMPILGDDDIGKSGRHAVDDGDHLRPTGNSQVTAIAKTILHIDHDER